MAWSPGMPVPAPGTPDYADYVAYANAQGGSAGAASAAGAFANQQGLQAPGAQPGWFSPVSQVQQAGQATNTALGAPPVGDGQNLYSPSAGTNEHGGAYNYFAAYDNASQNPNLTAQERNKLYEEASAGTSQVRNPYDYVIGRDRDYVGNMAAQQQAIGQGAAAQYQGLANQAGNAQLTGDALLALGVDTAGYGQAMQQGISAGAANLAKSGNMLMGQGGGMAQRQAPQLDFNYQSQALGNQQRYADQLGNLTQGPSAAQGMLQAGANQSMAQSLALARSGRGFGGSAAGQAQALQQNAATMQNVSNQSAILRAQEDQAWRAQQAQNYAQAANIYGQVGSQFGQQQALSAQTQLAQQSANDQAAAQLYGLGLQGQGAALTAQTQGGQLGLAGLAQGANTYSQGAQIQNQGTQLQGQMVQQGAAAQSQAGLNAFGMNQAQNATDMQREGMVSQEYGIRSGVALQNQQIQQQEVGSAIGAGAALGAGLLMLSDERVKTDIRPTPVDLRGAGSYSYQYAPGSGDSGSHVGPMAQELESLPGVVQTGPDGLERVDTGRLSLANAAATGDTQRRVDRLEQMLAIAMERKGRSGAAPPKRTSARARSVTSDPEDAPVTSGLGLKYSDFYRDTSPSAERVDTRRAHLPEPQGARDARRIAELDSTYDRAKPLPVTDPVKAFGRNAVAHAFDTAALPVTLAGRAAEAAGYPNEAAHLDANTALEGIDYLSDRRGHDPAEYRRYVSEERAQNPMAARTGAMVGDAVGGAAMGGLASRGAGAALRMAPKSWADAVAFEEPASLIREREAAAFLRNHPDVDALRGYMQKDFRGMNDAIRAEHGLRTTGMISEAELPRYREQAGKLEGLLSDAERAGHYAPGTVQRGLDLPEETLRDWVNRGAVENRTFWSATEDASKAIGEARSRVPGSRPVLLNLEHRSGVPVHALNPKEAEVLFGPGKKWELRGQRLDADGRTVLDLAQVDKFKPGTTPALSLRGEGFNEARGRFQSLISDPARDKERRYSRGGK